MNFGTQRRHQYREGGAFISSAAKRIYRTDENLIRTQLRVYKNVDQAQNPVPSLQSRVLSATSLFQGLSARVEKKRARKREREKERRDVT